MPAIAEEQPDQKSLASASTKAKSECSSNTELKIMESISQMSRKLLNLQSASQTATREPSECDFEYSDDSSFVDSPVTSRKKMEN